MPLPISRFPRESGPELKVYWRFGTALPAGQRTESAPFAHLFPSRVIQNQRAFQPNHLAAALLAHCLSQCRLAASVSAFAGRFGWLWPGPALKTGFRRPLERGRGKQCNNDDARFHAVTISQNRLFV